MSVGLINEFYALVREQHDQYDKKEHVILGLYPTREQAEAQVLILFRGRYGNLDKTRIVKYPIGQYLPQINMGNYEVR